MNANFRSPAEVLDDLGITSPGEIAIETIAESCGATIVYEPLKGCAARIVGHGGRAIITVDAAAPRPRQRFSAGHELGHWMYDRGRVAFACTERNFVGDWFEGSRERRANRFAADLLLPTHIFTPAARGRPITFDSVRDLANAFEMSLTATAIRLVELGSYPALVVCSDGNGRRWYTASKIVPTELRPRRETGRGSYAAALLGNRGSAASGTVDADEWIDHADAHRYCIEEDSRLVAGGLVLSLIWWKDEQEILDLDDADDD